MTVSKAIIPVLEKIESLRHEMHSEISDLKHEMGSRLTAVETALGMRNQSKSIIKAHFLDYSFKAGWLIIISAVSAVTSYLTAHLHTVLQ